jgi:hypothetical protein
VVPFTLPEVRRWPAVATEFAPAAPSRPSTPARTCWRSRTGRARASRADRLHYRPVADQHQAGTIIRFELPGTRSLYGMPPGKGDPRDNPYLRAGSFEYGDERRAALLRLPWSTLALQGVSTREVFLRIRPDEF